MKGILILGSTGSVGKQTLDVVRGFGGALRVAGLTCNSNINVLAKQIREFHPDFAFVADPAATGQIKRMGLKCEFRPRTELISAISAGDIVVAAMSGIEGIPLVQAALVAGKKVVLANKEALVCEGREIMDLADSLPAQRRIPRSQTDSMNALLPIDSEHSAVWQCIEKACRDGTSTEIKSITLIASGGPFFGYTKEQLSHVTLEQALSHPTWKMGPEISLNSATLMNKAFEIIEARWLFFPDLPDSTDWTQKIKVKVERTSHLHAYVEFADGRILAQISPPDMKEPIRYALEYAAGLEPEPRNIIDFDHENNDFKLLEPDFDVFPAPMKAYEALQKGDEACRELYKKNSKRVADWIGRAGGI